MRDERCSRGAPAHLRMDNGPELASAVLCDWCRIWGTHTAYIEPGSPWENPYIESFNGRLRGTDAAAVERASVTGVAARPPVLGGALL